MYILCYIFCTSIWKNGFAEHGEFKLNLKTESPLHSMHFGQVDTPHYLLSHYVYNFGGSTRPLAIDKSWFFSFAFLEIT